MENAVRFDQDANAVYVKYQIDGVNGLELSTLMNAMDVSKNWKIFPYSFFSGNFLCNV